MPLRDLGPGDPVFRLETEPELRAMRSAARRGILRTLIGVGPCSARDLANAMARTPQGVYRHFGILERAGLIASVERVNPKSGRPERVYRTLASFYEIGEGVSPHLLSMHADGAEADLRQAGRAYRAGVESGASLHGDALEASVHTAYAWLTERERCELNRALLAAVESMDLHRPRPGARLFGLTVALYPDPGADRSDD